MGIYIYKFNPEDAERFARHVGLRFRHRGDQLELIGCPYCRATTDKWTFGINMDTGQFECKRASCGVKGNMITLSRDFGFSLGREVDAYYQTANYSNKQYKKFRDAHRSIEVREPAIEYLKGRGISEEIARRYEITTRTDADNILVFPFKDESGELMHVKYRKTDFDKARDKNKEWSETGCKPILFGMNHCQKDEDGGTLIITEGQIDSLSVAEAGYTNAVSVPNGANGFTWIPYCYDFVSQFQNIVVMGDCENGKITLAKEIASRWQKKTKCCRPEDYKGCKDANELLQNYGIHAIRACIQNAEPCGTSHSKKLSSVRKVDIMKMKWFYTGIPSLDEVLDGGFRFGQLAILTGRRGEGKSTIASQIGVNALAQGYNCYLYSGELKDFYVRNWMDCQVTGKAEITQSDYDKLDAWYGDRVYLYDADSVDFDTEETVYLPEEIETNIIQHNCQFIMVDNLMTAISDDMQLDLYRQQSKFVAHLAAIAKKYNVFILLICHPRKTNGNLDNDDVSGSGNITDRADIVLTFGKVKDRPEDSRRICVTKNRLTGKCLYGDKGIDLVYDEKSRRLAEHTSDFFNIDFGWDTDVYEFEDVDDLTIPF